MIIGLGSDIVSMDRVAKQLERSGKIFKEKYFTAHEITASQRYAEDNKKGMASHFARRFAAKEAFAKAVGTGIGKHIGFKDIGVENDTSGKPFIVLSAKGASLLQGLAGEGRHCVCHLSMSDDYPYALAVVIIVSCLPQDSR